MNRQVIKRLLSSVLAVVFVVSTFATQSAVDYAAANANGITGSNYVIACDTQQYVATTNGELPNFKEIRPGKIRHAGYDNGSHSGGSSSLSYEYTVKNAYRTTNGKVLYPGEQIICIDHWTRYSFEKEGSMTVLQSYGLSFMMGNFAAKWENFDKKIPREPRIDLLSVNSDFGAFSDPNDYQGSNGDPGTFLPEDDPKDDPDYDEDFDTTLAFTAKSESGKEIELNYFGDADPNHDPIERPMQYAIFPLESYTVSDLEYSKMLTAATSDQHAYASTDAGPVPSNWYMVVPYMEYKGQLYGVAPSEIAKLEILTRDLQLVDVRNDPSIGIKSFPLNRMPNWGADWAIRKPLSNEGVSYFVMSSTAELEGTDYFTFARNSRILTFKDYKDPIGTTNFFGKNTWQYDQDYLYAQVNDLDRDFEKHNADRAIGLFTRMVNTFEAAISKGDFTNLMNITLNEGDYSGLPFATGYKGSKTAPYANYYNPFYSLLSIATYNYYSHNNMFSHVLADGTKVPRYFSGSGIGAKTAVADQGLQGSTKIQPFWGWQSFKDAHGANYGFCGDMTYPAGNMPNGKTAEANADRMILLAEYINNKMTRSIRSDAMTKIASLPSTVNNKDTFEAAITWNTSITKKFNDPQDLEKMYHFSFDDEFSFGSSFKNASFLVTDESGNTTKTAASDYILVGPFYAHTDYPESRMKIGFTENIDVSGLAQAGDEIITSTTSDGQVVADYVILTSEDIVNNRGEAGTDRRKTDLYTGAQNSTEYMHPMSSDARLMQSYEVVNGNVPLTNADLGKFEVPSPREVVSHQPTYWDGTTTDKDLYDPNLNKTAKNPKFIINNWGKGEFFVAVRRTTNNIFVNDLPQVTVGYESQTGTLTQTNVDLTNTSHSADYQGFLITDSEVAKSSAIVDLNLNLANIKINKAEDNGTRLNNKMFYLYRLADKDPSKPETDPSRFEWVRYVPVYADMGKGIDVSKDTYYPHFTDDLGNVSFNGLIPGWYMIYEKVDYSFRKVDYLQTHDPNEPERRGVPIEVDNSGSVDAEGQPYNTSVTLPQAARGQNIPIDDPLGHNPEIAGDVFYVDNGKVKGIDMKGTNTMDYNVYGDIENDPIMFFKDIGDVNKLVGEDGQPLDITRSEYSRNIQFVFQAEENKNEFYVAPVNNGVIMMADAEIHKGSFPAEDEWIPFDTGEKVDIYWWINSHHVRIEEHINPALGISKEQVKAITQHINTGRYDNDLMKYSNMANDELYENNIETPSTPIILKIVKKDNATGKTLSGAAFTLKCDGMNVYATSDNERYSGNPNAYLTDGNGELTFIIDDPNPDRLQLLKNKQWTLTEVAAPDGYTLPDVAEWSISFRSGGKYIEALINGERKTAIEFTKEIQNIPYEDDLGSITVTKDWYQYINGQKVQWPDGESARFNLYRGQLGDRRDLQEPFTLSQDNPTFKLDDLQLGDYWIEEVNVPDGVSISYSAQAVTLTKDNPNATINVENVKHGKYDYTIAIAKKKSKQASMTGTSDSAFSMLPYYDGPAQFVITYNGPLGEFETTVTYDRSNLGPDGYLKIKVPYYGDYRIREINIPEGYEPEIKVAGTGVEWSPIGEDTPFGFYVPDNPGETVALTLQVTNNKPASLSVIKTDLDTGERIFDTNMELTMYADRGGRPGQQLGIPKRMSEDGRFVFKTTDGYNFKVGDTVWLVETNPPRDPNGNQYKPIQLEVYISDRIAYENEVIEMKNELEKSKFSVTKVGPNKEPIEGAIFEVYSDEECKMLITSGKTNANGVIEFEVRGSGPFYVKEVYVPEPYVIDGDVKVVTVGEGQTPNLEVVNKKEFRIVVKKIDAVTGDPVPNVEFMLLNSNKQPYMIDGTQVTGVSDAIGNIIWNITDSKYLTIDTDEILYLRETSTPGGYFKPDHDFKIDLSEGELTESGINAGCYVFAAKNDAKYGVRIKKTEVVGDRPATPNETPGIQGIQFKIFNGQDECIFTGTTDAHGVIEVKGLKYGEYYAVEQVDPNSIYEPIEGKIPLVLKPLNDDGNFFEDSWSTYTWVENSRKTGSVSLLKVDNEGNVMPDISFAIYKYNGKGIPNEFKESECTLLKVDKTSVEGKLLFDNLELGKYWIVEKTLLPTYVMADPIFVEITPDETHQDIGNVVGRYLDLRVVNTRLPASIKIVKVDNETQKPLGGVKFTLTDGVTTVQGVTNSDGILTFENVKRGVKYTLIEVEAPDSYIVNEQPIEITLSELDTVLEVKLVNSKNKGTIQIIKVDEENGNKVIPNAEFQLFADGKPVGEVKRTDAQGRIEWTDLVIGPNYEVQEVSVPKPYVVDRTKIPVIFDDDGEGNLLFQKTVTNRAEKFYVRLWKVDGETLAGLPGAKFDLYKADKVTKLNREPIVTGANGMIPAIEVPSSGTYFFKEVEAPAGYVLDGRWIEATAYSSEGSPQVVIVENSKVIDKSYFIELVKIDGDTSQALAGAEFTLYDEGHNKIQSKVTGNSGTVRFEVKKAGTYYVRETKAPDGYELIDKEFVFNVNETQAVYRDELPNFKEKEYTIRVYKKDKDSNAPLANATFEVFDSSYNKLGVLTTTLPNGTGEFKVDKEGTYYLKELKAPEGYELIDGYIPVTVGGTVNVVEKTIYNEKVREYFIKVVKKDKENNAPLADAVFDLYASDKQTVIDRVTTQIPNGSASIKVPGPGTYYLKEVKAPAGYKLIEGFIAVEAGAEVNVVEKTVYDERNDEYWINVFKRDSVNNAPLADATFNVYESDKTTLVGTVTTQLPNGSASIKVPHKGTYYLKEVKAPNGYKLIDGYIPVEVGSTANVVDKTIYNERDKFFITVYKRDSVNNAPLGDAEFEVYDESNRYIGKFTTQLPTGSATFEVPNAGTYFLKEVKAPAGYVLKPGMIPVSVGGTTNVVERTIYNEKAETPNYIIKVYKQDEDSKAPLSQAVIGVYDSDYKLVGKIVTELPDGSGYLVVDKPGTYYLKELEAPRGYKLLDDFIPVTVNSNTNIVESCIYNVKEETPKNSVEVLKVDENGDSLSGVKFGLYDSKDKLIDTGYTDKRGELVFEYLDDGTYYVVEEKALPGYVKDDTEYKVKVSGGDEETIKIVNKKEEGDGWLSIKKFIDGTSTPLSGVKFRITSANGYDRTLTTDMSGSIYIAVPEGRYMVQEVEGVVGYEVDTMAKEIDVVSDEVARDLVFYNKPTGGTFAITKVDANTKARLANAKFGVYDTAGNQVATLTTDSNGQASTMLPYGEYVLRELEAPSGYILDSKSSANFVVDSSRPFVEMTIANNRIPNPVIPPKTGNGGNGGVTSVIACSCLAIASLAGIVFINRDNLKRFRSLGRRQ